MSQSLASLIGDLLDRLTTGRLTVGYSGTLQRGSARGTVAIEALPDEPTSAALVVTFDVMRLPPSGREAVYERLLECNGVLNGRAAFMTRPDGMVCLRAGRPTAGLDAGELIDLIVWTADQADAFDDELLAEFGAELAP